MPAPVPESNPQIAALDARLRVAEAAAAEANERAAEVGRGAAEASAALAAAEALYDADPSAKNGKALGDARTRASNEAGRHERARAACEPFTTELHRLLNERAAEMAKIEVERAEAARSAQRGRDLARLAELLASLGRPAYLDAVSADVAAIVAARREIVCRLASIRAKGAEQEAAHAAAAALAAELAAPPPSAPVDAVGGERIALVLTRRALRADHEAQTPGRIEHWLEVPPPRAHAEAVGDPDAFERWALGALGFQVDALDRNVFSPAEVLDAVLEHGPAAAHSMLDQRKAAADVERFAIQTEKHKDAVFRARAATRELGRSLVSKTWHRPDREAALIKMIGVGVDALVVWSRTSEGARIYKAPGEVGEIDTGAGVPIGLHEGARCQREIEAALGLWGDRLDVYQRAALARVRLAIEPLRARQG